MEVATRSVQSSIDAVLDDALSSGELCELARHPAALVRTNALRALVPYAKVDPPALAAIVAAASDPANAVRLMGTTTVAHVAVGCLFAVGTPGAVAAAERLRAGWPEPDRDDLDWYLHSEGFAADCERARE